MLSDGTVIAVIPARSGSKGVPDKNVRTVGGLNLIEHVAKVVSEIPHLCAVVSTDSVEYQEAALDAGLDCWFLRDKSLATDTACSLAVWKDAWEKSERYYGRQFENGVLLEPTSPLRRASDVVRCVELLDSGYDSVVAVSRIPHQFSPYKALKESDGNLTHAVSLPGRSYLRRQDLADSFYRNGAVYGARKQFLFCTNDLVGSNTAALVIERKLVNIDDEADIAMAEDIFRQMGNEIYER